MKWIGVWMLMGCWFQLAAQGSQILVLNEAKEPMPAASVEVFLKGGHLHQLTDGNGMAFFPKGLSTGTRIKIRYAGYLEADTTYSGMEAPFSITLQQLSVALQPVEVKAIRAGEKMPFVATTLNKQQIQRNNLGQDIPFLLNQTANVVVNSDAGNGIGYTGIRIRGTDATRINMTINGIPYNDAESQGTFFVNLPDLLSSVSSVQVQRGVGTSSNGPGAFGATMNFSTHDYQPKAYAELNNSYGSFNTWKHTLKAGSGLINDQFTIDMRLSRISSDGYVDRATTNLQSAFISAAWWGKNESLKFNAILGKEKTYQAWYGISQDDLKNNRTVNYAGMEKPGEPYDNETDNYWQNHYQLFYNKSLPNKLVFNTALYLTTGRGYYEQYKAGEALSDYGLPPAVVGNNSVDTTDLIRRLWLQNKLFGQIFSLQQQVGEHEWSVGGGWSYYPGRHLGEVIRTEVQPAYTGDWYDFDAQKTDANLYAKYRHKLNKEWDLFGDLQYRFVDYQIDGFRNNPAIDVRNRFHFLNPKAGIFYQKGSWSGFFSYAMANKEPNRDDFEAGINEQPRREQLHDLELQVRRRNLAKGLNVQATAYYMHYKDQLILTGKVNDVGAYTRTNVPNSFRMGIELEADYQWAWGRILYSLALSRNRAIDFVEFLDKPSGGQLAKEYGNTDLAFSPGVVTNGVITLYPFPRVTLDWMHKYVGRQNLDNTSTVANSLDAFYVSDARLAYSTSIGKWLKEVNLIFQVNNLFNTMYEPNGFSFSYLVGQQRVSENYFYPMAGTNVMAAINIRL